MAERSRKSDADSGADSSQIVELRPTRAQKRTAQCDRILEAARTLFSDRGPETVTVAEVAAEAGVSRATVFNHFGSKHALLEGITEGVLGDYITILRNALEAARSAAVVTVEPRIVRGDDGKAVLHLPKEAGYDVIEAPLDSIRR